MSVTISAKEVNELRQKTGSGMMDCKKALVESGGDFYKAIDIPVSYTHLTLPTKSSV